ncbi:MAG: hypothetical protein GX113_02885 [Actinobacteria bacterium]|jgi:hypothetical protein|nr:hypothetical protein [Actinomycetota bacterium]
MQTLTVVEILELLLHPPGPRLRPVLVAGIDGCQKKIQGPSPHLPEF